MNSGANPCSCDCNASGDASNVNNLIAGTLQGLADSLNNIGSTAIKNYTANVIDAIPDYVKQFMANPAAVNAADVENAKAAAFQYNTPVVIGTGVGEIASNGYSVNSAGDFYNDFLTGKDNNLKAGVYNFAKRPVINIGAEYSSAGGSF